MNPELEARLSALLDGELDPDEAAALRAELAREPALAARLAELGAVDEALRALPSRTPPAELRARLAERIRAEARAFAARAPGRRTLRLATAALAAAAAALALVLLTEPRREEPQIVAEDLPVIEVLDVLAELDELEGIGNG